MAKIKFTIEGKPGAVTLSAFLVAVQKQLAILRDVDAALSGKPDGVLQWYVSDLSLGSYAVGAVSRIERDDVSVPLNHANNVVRTYRNGLRLIEDKGDSPEYFTDTGIRAARDAFQLIGRQGVSGYRVTATRAKPIEITARSAVHAEELIKPGRTVYGSVEGKLNVISIQGSKWRFVVFTTLAKKGVSCIFPKDRLAEVTASLGKRMLVSGMLTYNRKGEPQKVNDADWRVLRERSDLPTTEEMFGKVPDLTGDESMDEYLQDIRGE